MSNRAQYDILQPNGIPSSEIAVESHGNDGHRLYKENNES